LYASRLLVYHRLETLSHYSAIITTAVAVVVLFAIRTVYLIDGILIDRYFVRYYQRFRLCRLLYVNVETNIDIGFRYRMTIRLVAVFVSEDRLARVARLFDGAISQNAAL